MKIKIILAGLGLMALTAYADIDAGAVTALVTQNTIVAPASTTVASAALPVQATAVQAQPLAQGLDPAIAALVKNYTIVVFYESTCPHCQRFTPILKQFADEYGFTVYAFSVDGPALPAFPKPMAVNQQIVNTFFPTGQVVLPTSFLVNKANLMTYPINTGEMLMPDLLSRMDTIAAAIQNPTQGATP